MGFVVRRCMYGAAGQDVKQKAIAAVARFVEILRTSADVSLGVKFKGPLKINIIQKEGTPSYHEDSTITDHVFKELVNANSFKIEFDIQPTSRSVKKGYPSRFLVWYDEKKNMGTSFNVEITTEYPEGVLSFKFFGFLGVVNLVKLTTFRTIAEGMNKRIQDLWESVLRTAFGTFTKTERRFQLRKYEPDALVLNVFGKMTIIKE